MLLAIVLLAPAVVAQMGGGGGGWGRGRWGGGGGPQWLQQASQQTQDAVKQVFQDRSLDWQTKKNYIRALMQKESPQVQAMFAQHEQERQQRRQQMEQRFNQISGTLSPQARAAHEQIRAMFKDHSIPWSEKRNRIDQYKMTLPQSVQTELENARQQMFPGGGEWGGHRGGFGGGFGGGGQGGGNGIGGGFMGRRFV